MNELMTFKNDEFGKLRTIDEDGKIWFCGADIANMLGYQNPRKAIADHCKEKCVTKRYIPHPQS